MNPERSVRRYTLHNNKGFNKDVELKAGDLVTCKDLNKVLIREGNFLWSGDSMWL